MAFGRKPKDPSQVGMPQQAQQDRKKEKPVIAPAPGDRGKAQLASVAARQARMKKWGALAIYFAIPLVFLLLMIATARSQQREIGVIRVKSDLLAGDVIITEGENANVEEFMMLEQTYNTLGKTTYVSDGKEVTKQIMVLWEERDRVSDKYMTAYTQAGAYLTERHVTDTTTLTNPHLASVPAGNEIYTLPFDVKGVDTQLLMPGTAIRVRLVLQVKSEAKQAIQEAVTTKDEDLVDNGIESAEDGSSVILDMGSEVMGSEFDVGTGTVPVAEVVFEKVIIIDMLNNQQESIFNIYTALLKMPLDERTKYLETTIEDPNTNFQKRVTPSSLVLSLNREQATTMAEFENIANGVIKYTILPQEGEDELLSQFFEISEQINNFIKDSPGSSLG